MSNRRFHLPLAALAAALMMSAGATVHAAGDATRGQEKSAPCQACHGLDGNSENAAFPRLGGQYASYIVHSLEAYASGERKNVIMQGFAAPLSAQDREDLAAWYSGQEGLEVLEGER